MSQVKGIRNTFVAALVALGGCIGYGAPANALNFDFSFTGTSFPTCNGSASNCINGTVTGEIFGLASSGISSATSVEIFSYPAALTGITTALNTPISSVENIFTVTGGSIATYGFESANSEFLLSLGAGNYLQDFTGGSGGLIVSGPVTFTPVTDGTATPLPATLPLFATGLGALGLLGWRRKRKHAASVTAA
jgi:hypothetical protein